jgi:hypothetical protein
MIYQNLAEAGLLIEAPEQRVHLLQGRKLERRARRILQSSKNKA